MMGVGQTEAPGNNNAGDAEIELSSYTFTGLPGHPETTSR